MCSDYVVLELESIINWSLEITNQFDSRVYALWNRSAGDCLLDSICQATWGIFDRENALRNALYVSLSEGASRYEVNFLYKLHHYSTVLFSGYIFSFVCLLSQWKLCLIS